MLTGSEMAIVDANTEALGVPRTQLMESSGHSVAQAVRKHADPGTHVTIVAGRGNNGGDGLVAARFLDEYDLRICLLGRPETITTDISRANWDALQSADYPTEQVRDSTSFDLRDPGLVVDAMLGTGVNGALREPAATVATAMKQSEATVISVDVPSGLDCETGDLAANAVDADHVITFHDTKPGLAALEASVTVADIGIPAAAQQFVERGDLQRLAREPTSHKGVNGEVLVVGGGPYTGAPALSAQAALRAGVDLVRVAAPEPVAREIQGYSENLIVHGYDGNRLAPTHVGWLTDLAADHDTLVLGPGLGRAETTLDAVIELLDQFKGVAVVDADALQVVPEVDTNATLICTPHQGEFHKMGGETSDDWRERTDLTAALAADIGHTILLKGAYDVISDGERTRVSRTGNAGMTVGGTGDVLAGVTGALACVLEPTHAAEIGAYVNGAAGDAVGEQYGSGLVATDLLEAVPGVLWDC